MGNGLYLLNKLIVHLVIVLALPLKQLIHQRQNQLINGFLIAHSHPTFAFYSLPLFSTF